MTDVHHGKRNVRGGTSRAMTSETSKGGGIRSAVPEHHVRYSTGVEPPKLRVPPNATDCHFHIYDKGFTPVSGGLAAPDATPDDYRALQKRLGTTRGVVVQPSLYGFDNRPTLEGMAALGPDFRAVVVVNPSVTDAELQRMHDHGVRGIRFNLAQSAVTTLDMLAALAPRVDALGWHCQINMSGNEITAASEIFLKIRGRLVFDHLAHCLGPENNQTNNFGSLRRLLDTGNVWVKLSGFYQDTKIGPPSYSDTVEIAKAFVVAAPNRVVWGSDWPHPTEHLNNKPDDALMLDLLSTYVAEKSAIKRILVGNPAELYDFPNL